MGFGHDSVVSSLARLGAALQKPTTLCLIGSTPAILQGQAERQTGDIDVWHPASDFDYEDLRRACLAAGVVFDPKEDLSPSDLYLQIVRPGIIALPRRLELEVVARFDRLTLVMPSAAVIAASKLVRGDMRDVEDVVWWFRQRGLEPRDLEEAVSMLPRATDRETATENLIIVRLVRGKPE